MQTMMAVFVCACTVSLHSALNEPIMGVYVALMRASVRRETLHRSPPNQWGLARYTTARFSPLNARPPSHHSFLLACLSFSLSPSHSFTVQLARDGNEVSSQLAMKRALNRARWGHRKVATLRSSKGWIFGAFSSKHFPPASQMLLLLLFIYDAQSPSAKGLFFFIWFMGVHIPKYKLPKDFNDLFQLLFYFCCQNILNVPALYIKIKSNSMKMHRFDLSDVQWDHVLNLRCYWESY